MKKVLLYFLLSLIIIYSGCKKDDANPITPPAALKEYNETGTIGNSGGIVKVTNQNSMIAGAYVEIPAGAAPSDTKISVIPPTGNVKLAFDTTALGVEFLPSGMTFNQPIKIAVPYDASVSDPSSLSIYYVSSDGKIEQLPVDVYDSNNRVLVAYTNHFSTFFSSQNDYVGVNADLLNINNKVGVKLEIFGKLNGNDIKLFGVPTELGFALVYGFFNVGRYLQDHSSFPYSVFYVTLLEKSLISITDPIIATKKFYVKREMYAGYSEQVGVYNESNNRIFLSPTVATNDQTWWRGVPLVFRFDDATFSSSKSYYVKVRWAVTDYPDIFYLALITPAYSFSGRGKAKSLSEMISFTDDKNSNNINDQYEPAINNNPNTPSLQSPSNGATNQSLSGNLTWQCTDPEGDPLVFDIYLGTSSSPSIFKSNQSGGSYAYSNLNYNKKYYWKIVAKDNKGGSSTSGVQNFTTLQSTSNQPPNKPENISPIKNGTNYPTSVTLSWNCSDPENDVLNYDVYFGNVNPPVNKVVTQAGKTLTRINLNNNTTYYWKIVAKDNQNTTTGDVWKFMTSPVSQNLPPFQPKNPSPADWSLDINTNVTLSWQCSDPEGDPITYDVYFGTTETPNKVRSDQTAKTYNPGALSQATQYYWKVVAKDNQGNISISPVWAFYTKGAAVNQPPAQPSNPEPTTNATGQATSLTLNWSCSDPEGDPIKYDVYLGTDNPPTTKVSALQSGTSYSASGLSNSTKYYWHIYAKDDHSNMTAGPVWNFTTTGTKPNPPTLSSPSNGATQQPVDNLTFSWNASSGADNYTLQVADNQSFNNPRTFLPTTNLYFTASGFGQSTTYYWHVLATNSYGSSAYSEVYLFTTASGATASISGTIKDNSNQPITGVKVYTSPATSTVYSDASGNYAITNISGGTYTVYAEKTGFNNYSITIDVSQGQAYIQNIVMTPNSTSGIPCPGIPTVYDSRDGGRTYNTVQIGTKCWLKENLNVGSRIDGNQNPSNNGSIEKYCYDDNEANCNTYGGLYQWNEAMQYSTTAGTRGICPPGWHIPTNAEFEALAAAVNNDGNALKAIGQGIGSGQGTNTSGFSALLAGGRYHDGYFYDLSYDAYFWSSTEYSSAAARRIYLNYGNANIYFDDYIKGYGFSVRCVKD